MEQPTFGKEAWIEMFRAIGLDRAAMQRWHHEFEARWPEAHESFLAWLGIGADEIARIRDASRDTTHGA
ncbi:MAG: hypothetical protein KC609_17615 [Myxococcales bacterium]|nr:hypothetical protein [Myxococcales bacterium]